MKDRALAMIREFAPRMRRFSTKEKIWIAIFLAIILWGLIGFVYMAIEGHHVTGMRDNVFWGLYIANFAFFIGISYGSALILGVLRLFRVGWRMPLTRIIETVMLITAIIGPPFIILCMGRLDRLHHLLFYGRIQSPIMWDVIAISTYVLGALLFLYLALVKDFSILRDNKEWELTKWRRKLYTFFSARFTNTPRQKKLLNLSIDTMAMLIIPVAVIVSSVLAWIFGLTLRPGWHSSIFGPYFVVASVFTAIAVLICMMWFFRSNQKLGNYITELHFKKLAIWMFVVGAVYGYLTFSEYLTEWFTAKKLEGELIHKMFDFGSGGYGWLFLFSTFVGIILPLVITGIPKFRKPKTVTFAAIIVVLAMWVKRYLVIVPTLETPNIPIQDYRPEYLHYTPTWVEWSATLAAVSFFFLALILLTKFYPIIPIWNVSASKAKEVKTEGNDSAGEIKPTVTT